MGISQKTIDVIEENENKFSKELFGSTKKLISLALQYSPLSDINFLIRKGEEKVPGVLISTNDSSWVPIRNVVRIVGKIADSSPSEMGKVQKIEIHSMYAGCDYFKGSLSCTSETGNKTSGEYKWQWTSFPGNEKHYNKFTSFPQKWINLHENQEEITV